MGFYTAIEISASGLSAERLAMDVIANNIANVNTTRTPQGGAFKRQLIVFAQKGSGPNETDGTVEGGTDPNTFNGGFGDTASSRRASVNGVEALGIANDPSPDRLVFDPGNPDADARGYVHYPNVQVVTEMVDMMAASRAYEANVSVMQETKSMNTAAMGLLS